MTREAIVMFCFIAIPIVLFLGHVLLSYQKNPYLGAIVPVIWAIISIFIIKAGTGDAYVEMTVFCFGIDFILILIWLGERVLRNKRKS